MLPLLLMYGEGSKYAGSFPMPMPQASQAEGAETERHKEHGIDQNVRTLAAQLLSAKVLLDSQRHDCPRWDAPKHCKGCYLEAAQKPGLQAMNASSAYGSRFCPPPTRNASRHHPFALLRARSLLQQLRQPPTLDRQRQRAHRQRTPSLRFTAAHLSFFQRLSSFSSCGIMLAAVLGAPTARPVVQNQQLLAAMPTSRRFRHRPFAAAAAQQASVNSSFA